jgi:hypothetical protein
MPNAQAGKKLLVNLMRTNLLTEEELNQLIAEDRIVASAVTTSYQAVAAGINASTTGRLDNVSKEVADALVNNS